MASLKFAVVVESSATQVLYKDETGRISWAKHPFAGIELCEALNKYLREERHYLVDRLSLEYAVQVLGCTHTKLEERSLEFQARNMDSGRPTLFQLSNHEVQPTIQSTVDEIVYYAVRQIAFRIPYASDAIIDNEVLLSGNFGWIRGLNQLLQAELRARNFPEAIVGNSATYSAADARTRG